MTDIVSSINTPGIYYALSYNLACWIIIAVSEKKRSWIITSVYQLIYFAIMSLVMYFTAENKVLFIPLTALYMMSVFWSIKFNCGFDDHTCLYVSLNAFLIGEFMASMHWMIYYFAVNSFGYPKALWANILMLVIVHTVQVTIFYKIEKKIRQTIDGAIITRKELISILIIAVAVYGTSNLYYVAGRALFGGVYASEVFVIRTLVDLGGVAILHAAYFQMGEFNTKLEMARLQDALNMQQANYEMLDKSMEIVNIKYHDLKHQIALLREGIDSGSSLEYLDKIERDIRVYEAQNKTGNKVLDTILTAKSIYCQNHWIELTVVADGEAISFMEPMDINALFGNMLDNAIESVEKIEHKEKRLIHLAVAHQKGFVRIRMENCYNEKPKIVNGHIVTSKKDTRYHGFGMKSIENIVQKYGGSVTIKAENGWFEQRILLPNRLKI